METGTSSVPCIRQQRKLTFEYVQLAEEKRIWGKVGWQTEAAALPSISASSHCLLLVQRGGEESIEQ